MPKGDRALAQETAMPAADRALAQEAGRERPRVSLPAPPTGWRLRAARPS